MLEAVKGPVKTVGSDPQSSGATQGGRCSSSRRPTGGLFPDRLSRRSMEPCSLLPAALEMQEGAEGGVGEPAAQVTCYLRSRDTVIQGQGEGGGSLHGNCGFCSLRELQGKYLSCRLMTSSLEGCRLNVRHPEWPGFTEKPVFEDQPVGGPLAVT